MDLLIKFELLFFEILHGILKSLLFHLYMQHVPSVAKNSESQTAVNFIGGRSKQAKSSPIFRQANMRQNV